MYKSSSKTLRSPILGMKNTVPLSPYSLPSLRFLVTLISTNVGVFLFPVVFLSSICKNNREYILTDDQPGTSDSSAYGSLEAHELL